ncbi:MAG: peptidoglycan DD-metalloendopeptidase family protein [Endomicrobium sp.]|jgi:septal ring factor EnvC (AmiA/AmiB activator)|nr:peptidoglycan DD-metalloendopeptidase family protein [Endomicrobium sp.]
MKRYNFSTTAVIFILSFFLCNAYPESESVKSNTTKQLSTVRQSIRAKEIEKKKLILQEKVCRKELKVINDQIKQTEKKLKEVSKNLEFAQKNFKESEKNYNCASLRSLNWHKTIVKDLNFFYKATFLNSYTIDPLVYKLAAKVLKYDTYNFEKEKKLAGKLALDTKKWKKSKNDLAVVKQKENNFITKNKDILKEKNNVLQTTSNKRRTAEKEIKALNDTAKALQALINKINSKNAAKKGSTAGHPRMQIKRKKSLPWPVDGKVISYFGKAKHQELDTYVINNGIKISTEDFSKVKSIDTGKVVFAGSFRSYGKVVIIDHKNMTFSVYGLLNKIYVKEGQKVSQGSLIADTGSGKNAVLYLEIRQNNIPDNPLLWLCSK